MRFSGAGENNRIRQYFCMNCQAIHLHESSGKTIQYRGPTDAILYLASGSRVASGPAVRRKTEHQKLQREGYWTIEQNVLKSVVKFSLNKKMVTKFSWLRPRHPERQTSLLSHSVAKKFPEEEKSKQSSSPRWSLCDLCSFCHLVGQPTRNREQDHTSLLAVSDGERMALYVGAFLPVICNLIVSIIVVTITILVFVPSMVQPLLAPSVITIIIFMIRVCFPSTSTILRNLNLLDLLLHLMIK